MLPPRFSVNVTCKLCSLGGICPIMPETPKSLCKASEPVFSFLYPTKTYFLYSIHKPKAMLRIEPPVIIMFADAPFSA